MEYCKKTRALANAYKRETDEMIFRLQRRIYDLQCRVFSMELERYFENKNTMSSHTTTIICPNCGHIYDAYPHWLVCPNCGHETPKATENKPIRL